MGSHYTEGASPLLSHPRVLHVSLGLSSLTAHEAGVGGVTWNGVHISALPCDSGPRFYVSAGRA